MKLQSVMMALLTLLHPGALCEAAGITRPMVTRSLHRPQWRCRIECGRNRSFGSHSVLGGTSQIWYCSWYQLSPELEPASDTPFFQPFSRKLQSLEILDGSACLTVSSSLGASLFFPAPVFQSWPPQPSHQISESALKLPSQKVPCIQK